jgi:excisionase family DNA binding protein
LNNERHQYGNERTERAVTHMNSQQANVGICEPLIDAERAAEILGLHPKTVKRLAAKGVVPGMKIGRVWRFRESELDAYIVRQLQWSGHPSPKGEAFQ